MYPQKRGLSRDGHLDRKRFFSDITLLTLNLLRFPQGHDTTAAAITWALYLLGRHPVIQQKVHEEVDSFLGEFVLSVFCFCFRFFFFS